MKLSYRWQTARRTYGDPPEKNGPLAPAFQGHLSLSELTRIDRVPVIGADTVLKLGAQTPVQSAGKFFFKRAPQICVVSPIPVAQRGHTTVAKTDIVKITRVKNKALLTWRLADIHDVSQNTPPEI